MIENKLTLTIGKLLELGLIDENQKIVVALFDGKNETILFKHYAHKMNDSVKNKIIEERGIATTTRYKDYLYIMVEDIND